MLVSPYVNVLYFAYYFNTKVYGTKHNDVSDNVYTVNARIAEVLYSQCKGTTCTSRSYPVILCRLFNTTWLACWVFVLSPKLVYSCYLMSLTMSFIVCLSGMTTGGS